METYSPVNEQPRIVIAIEERGNLFNQIQDEKHENKHIKRQLN